MRTVLLFLLAVLAGAVLLVYMKSPSHLPTLVRIQQNGKIGYIDSVGKMVIPAVYFNGSDFSEGVAAVRQAGVYGYIDPAGKYAISPQFDWAEPFSDGLAVVNKDGHYYYIDHDGQPAFPCHYQELSPFQHGVAVVQTYSDHRGLIDRHGKLLLDTLNDVITDFDEGLAVVNQFVVNGPVLEGLVDTLGHFIIPVGKYATVSRPQNGYCMVTDSSHDQIIIDRSGKVVLRRPETHKSGISTDGFSEGIAPIALYKYWEPSSPGILYSSDKAYMGYIDLRNNLLLNDTMVEDARPFSCGRSFIRLRGAEYRLIDTHMRRVGSDQYRAVKDPGFLPGYAIVSFDQGDAIIDTNGRVMFKPSDAFGHQLERLGDHFFIDHYWHGGMTNLGIGAFNGKMVCPPQLDDVDRNGFIHGRLKVIKVGRLAVIDTMGNMVWQDSVHLPSPLRALNTDYMLRGYFYAYSSPKKDGTPVRSGGWAVSQNIPKKIGNHPFGSGTLRLLIDTSSVDTFSSAYRGYPVYLANTTGDTCHFNSEDSRLYLKTQAQTENGSWKDIDYLPSSWCGNSYHTVELEPGAYWQFTMPQLEGSIPVILRLQLQYKDQRKDKGTKTLYSNAIRGTINPAQYWNKRPYYPQNVMDPYTD